MAQAKKNEEFKNQNMHINEILRQLASKFDLMTIHNKILKTQISRVEKQQVSSSTLSRTFRDTFECCHIKE